MLRYFNRDCRMNWIDSNNIFVGFSDEAGCCEEWGGDFYDSLGANARRLDIDLEVSNNWVFDPSFYDANPMIEIERHSGAICAAFRLVDGDKEMFLVLWNDHNGYYAHGFEFCNGDTVIVKDRL